MTINITSTEIITATIIGGIVRAVWAAVKWGLKHLETEAGRIIESHIKDGHDARLKHCLEDGCIKLGIGSGSPGRSVDSQPKLPQEL